MKSVTTVILAGGRGTRMGGNKGLQILRGKPLMQWVLESVRPQSAEILISANGDRAEYAEFGCPVIADRMPEGSGPLAGLHSALLSAHHEWIVSVPCDTPYLPGDLIDMLFAAVGDAEAAVAVAAGRRQPAIALYRKNVLPKLDTYLASGKRKVGEWLDLLHVHDVEFDDAAGFANINSLEELVSHERLERHDQDEPDKKIPCSRRSRGNNRLN
jgi:molybdenum cofactor guanylyltransferase